MSRSAGRRVTKKQGKRISRTEADEAVEEAKQIELRRQLEEKQPQPFRVQLNFTVADNQDCDDLIAIHDAIIEEAERRGYFFEFGFVGPMGDEEVIEDSPLAEALDSMREAHFRGR